jgi:hypothetical protein
MATFPIRIGGTAPIRKPSRRRRQIKARFLYAWAVAPR